MKTYKFAEWDNFPIDQEIFKELQNYYTTGLNSFFESMKTTAPMLIGGCNVVSGTIGAGGVVSDGIMYHPTHGLMLVKGGPFDDDAGFDIHVENNDLTFDGNIDHPAEQYKYITINTTGSSDFINMYHNRWINALSTSNIPSTFITVVDNANAKLRYRVNQMTATVEVDGFGKWEYQDVGGGQMGNMSLGIAGFTSLSVQMLPSSVRPRTTVRGFATTIEGTGPYSFPQQYYRTDGAVFQGSPIVVQNNGHIRLAGYPLSGNQKPLLYFHFTYML